MAANLPPLPNTVYASFAGAIDAQSINRIFNGLSTATQRGVGIIHFLFQSTGGLIGDGIALYNFIRGVPLELHMYNAGAVQSVAVLGYLAAAHRHVSAHGAFLIHKTHANPQPGMTAAQAQAASQSLAADDTRTEAILRAHTNIAADRWALHERQDMTFNAQEAVQFGIAQDIREFVVPAGNQIFNL